MNWWIDETPYPGPSESQPNYAPSPTVNLAGQPPVDPQPGDIWVSHDDMSTFVFSNSTWERVGP